MLKIVLNISTALPVRAPTVSTISLKVVCGAKTSARTMAGTTDLEIEAHGETGNAISTGMNASRETDTMVETRGGMIEGPISDTMTVARRGVHVRGARRR